VVEKPSWSPNKVYLLQNEVFFVHDVVSEKDFYFLDITQTQQHLNNVVCDGGGCFQGDNFLLHDKES
jgi:hypothetical protein